MTRKDYEKFARMLRNELNASGTSKEFRSCVEYAAGVAARVFAEDNPRFDKQRFLTACGVE
jgi:hypothetical protein